MNHGVLGITTGIADSSDGIACMQGVAGITRTKGAQLQSQIHLSAVLYGISQIVDKLLVETVIAIVLQERCQSGAFLIEGIHIEYHSFMKSVPVILQKFSHHTVLNVIVQIPDDIMPARMKHIIGIEFLSFDIGKQFHLSVQISQITKSHLECLTRFPCL